MSHQIAEAIIIDREVLGFACNRLPDKNYSWTLTSVFSHLLFEVEERFGPRDREWTPLGIEFSGQDGPRIWFPGNRKHISIVLSDAARIVPKRAIFQISHEVIHLLSPAGMIDGTPVIEEGLAVANAHRVSRDWKLDFWHVERNYLDAEKKTAMLLEETPDAIRIMRERQPSFRLFNADLICSVAPAFPREIAEQLCQPFVY